MKPHQQLYYDQAKSDWEMFNFLLQHEKAQCHCLHFLQMCTEKLGKAGKPSLPGKVHHGFVKFLHRLKTKKSIWQELEFPRLKDLVTYVTENAIIAQRIENLAANEQCAGDGPNPEYPWPPHNPTTAPIDHHFTEWDLLLKTGKGRKFRAFLQRLFDVFPDWF